MLVCNSAVEISQFDNIIYRHMQYAQCTVGDSKHALKERYLSTNRATLRFSHQRVPQDGPLQSPVYCLILFTVDADH